MANNLQVWSALARTFLQLLPAVLHKVELNCCWSCYHLRCCCFCQCRWTVGDPVVPLLLLLLTVSMNCCRSCWPLCYCCCYWCYGMLLLLLFPQLLLLLLWKICYYYGCCFVVAAVTVAALVLCNISGDHATADTRLTGKLRVEVSLHPQGVKEKFPEWVVWRSCGERGCCSTTDWVVWRYCGERGCCSTTEWVVWRYSGERGCCSTTADRAICTTLLLKK